MLSAPAITRGEVHAVFKREQTSMETKGLEKMSKSALIGLGLVLALASAGAAAQTVVTSTGLRHSRERPLRFRGDQHKHNAEPFADHGIGQ